MLTVLLAIWTAIIYNALLANSIRCSGVKPRFSNRLICLSVFFVDFLTQFTETQRADLQNITTASSHISWFITHTHNKRLATTDTSVNPSFHLSSLSYDRSKASSKASSPHSAIQSFFLQMKVSSPFLKGHPIASYVFFLVFLSLLSPLVSFLQ